MVYSPLDTIIVGEAHYDVRVRVYDSFGEEAFRLQFEQTSAGTNKGAVADCGHPVREKQKASRRRHGR